MSVRLRTTHRAGMKVVVELSGVMSIPPAIKSISPISVSIEFTLVCSVSHTCVVLVVVVHIAAAVVVYELLALLLVDFCVALTLLKLSLETMLKVVAMSLC